MYKLLGQAYTKKIKDHYGDIIILDINSPLLYLKILNDSILSADSSMGGGMKEEINKGSSQAD